MAGGTKATRTITEPWKEQKERLNKAFGYGDELYAGGSFTPDYYGYDTDTGEYTKPFVAGMDPEMAVTGSGEAYKYITGDIPEELRAAAGYANIRGGEVGRGMMDYALGATTGSYDDYTPFDETAYSTLLAGTPGDTSSGPFKDIADVYRKQAMGQLTDEVLPGIRQSITQYQPGGSTRGDMVQAQAVSSANQQIADNIAKAQFGEYQAAQQRRMAAAQMGMEGKQAAIEGGIRGGGLASAAGAQYPSIMGAPMQLFGGLSDIGKQRQAQKQAEIDAAMQAYGYTAQLPQIGLQNYLASISGDWGGATEAMGPGGPSPFVSALAGGASGYLSGGPMGAAIGAGMGYLGSK